MHPETSAVAIRVSGSKWVQSRELDIYRENGSLCNLCGFALGSYLSRYTVLMNSKKGETAVHHCDPALSVLTRYSVSQNVFHLVSTLSALADQISCRSPTLTSFIACGPLQFLISHCINSMLFDPRGIL